MVNLIKSNKNNALEIISNILDTLMDKSDYNIKLKNGLYLLNMKQSLFIKVVKTFKENDNLKFMRIVERIFNKWKIY